MSIVEDLKTQLRDALERIGVLESKMPTYAVEVIGEGHPHDLGLHLGGVVAARVYNSGNLTIQDATWTALTFDSERYDTDGIHSTSSNTNRLTCKTAGKYRLTGQVEWGSTAGVGERQLGIRLNGATYISQKKADAAGDSGAAHPTRQDATTECEMAVDDYVELMVEQNIGGTLSVVANSAFSPEFMMSRIGAAGGTVAAAASADHGGLGGLPDDDHPLYLLAAGSRAGSTGTAQGFGTTGITTDVVAESTAGAGVSVANAKITDVVDPTAAQDAATKGYAERFTAITHGGDPDAHHPETRTHASLSGIGPDDHHSQAHPVASHSDTTATGTQLDTVTDGSEVDAEHMHRLTTYITIGSETGDGISYTV